MLWPPILPELPRETYQTLVNYLQRHFFNHPAFFSWTSPKENLLQIISKIYVLFLFPNNLLVCNLKVFIFTKQELLTPFLISWILLTECYSKLLPTTSAKYLLFSCTFHESISIDVSKKTNVILCYLWICSKNLPVSNSHYL